MVDIQSIREKVKKGKYQISFTHTEKLRKGAIEIAEIEDATSLREVIESEAFMSELKERTKATKETFMCMKILCV